MTSTATSYRRSWVTSANEHRDFPLQNLPFGIFSPQGLPPRGGVAIGDVIFDLQTALENSLFTGVAQTAAQAASGKSLNAFFALPSTARLALRERLLELLDADYPQLKNLQAQGEALLRPAADCTMHLPAKIGDYTDFYTGIHHAVNVGKLFRPDNPLLPNYKYVPIGYHGRSSTIYPSGFAVRRPLGQTLKPGAEMPTLTPSARLDYELELGIWIAGSNPQGEGITIENAPEHIAGFCLLNDWSARDLQAWEYQPLGPFLAKNFATTVSPWVVTAEALAPYRSAQAPRPEGDPQPLPYLFNSEDQASGAFNIELEVLLHTAAQKAQGLPPHRLGLSNTLNMYWTVAQLITHHTVNGCSLRPGDLLGTGTLSGPTPDSLGSLLEISNGGKQAIKLNSGEERCFLADGDEIIMLARCKKEGHPSIGFGECRGVILAVS